MKLKYLMSFALLVSLPVSLAPGCAAPPKKKVKRKKVAEAKPTLEVGHKTRKKIPEGHVLFLAEEADLKDEVLPIFQKQVGVRIYWHGEPRKLSVRFTRPIPWEDALEYVCRFTRTHPTHDYQGRLVLKPGWGGSLYDDSEVLKGRRKGTPGAARGKGAAASGGSKGTQTFQNTYGTGGNQGAYSGGKAATDVLKGTTRGRSSSTKYTGS